MNHPETEEFGVLQARNQAQHASLLSPFHLRLEAHEAVVITREVILAQLNRGIGLTSGPGIAEAVTRQMLKIDGIVRSETLIAFRAFSRYDLERIFSIGAEESAG